MRRIVALCLALSMCMSMLCLSAAATQSRTEHFSDDYELVGNGGADMVSIALAQEGRTGSQMGYTEEWCANFVSDCAILAGQGGAIPANGTCSGLYQNILNAGGKVTTSDPQPGDICFINWSGGSSMQHVEIVYAVSGGCVYTIGGNSGSGSSLYSRHVRTHAPLSDAYIVKILRPAYVTTKVSYTSQCEWYSSYCALSVLAPADLMSQPCGADTDEASDRIATAGAGESLTATALAVNTEGEIWYRVSAEGRTAYIAAADTEFIQALSDISLSGVSVPDSLEYGAKFSIGGTVSSDCADIVSVGAYVMSGDCTVTGTSADTDTRSYSLKGSAVDKGLTFSTLSAGTYIYVILAQTQSYYTPNGSSLEKAVTETELYRCEFTVAEPHVCDREVFVGYSGEHPHWAVYACSGCGKQFADNSQIQQQPDCTDCFPEELEEEIPVPEPEETVEPDCEMPEETVRFSLDGCARYLCWLTVLPELTVKVPPCCGAAVEFLLSLF